MTAYGRTPPREQDCDGAETDRQPFTARATDARIRANDSVVEFGTPRCERVDDARVAVEATAGDSAVPEPAVTITVTTSLGNDDDDAVAAAVSLSPSAAVELAEYAETCAAVGERRDAVETTVPATAAVGRLSTQRADVTLVENAEACAGILFSDGDDAPALVIDTDTSTSSTVPHVGAGATIPFNELRALAEALRHESAYVEEG